MTEKTKENSDALLEQISDASLRDQLREREEILSAVRRILIERLKVAREAEEIDPDTPLFGTGLHLDSVDAVELVVAIEGELGLVFDEEEVGPSVFRTVSSVVDAVIARLHPRHLDEDTGGQGIEQPE